MVGPSHRLARHVSSGPPSCLSTRMNLPSKVVTLNPENFGGTRISLGKLAVVPKSLGPTRWVGCVTNASSASEIGEPLANDVTFHQSSAHAPSCSATGNRKGEEGRKEKG